MARILIAYFSAKGTTRTVAERLAHVPQSELFEIAPRVPYSQADLTFMNPHARCNVEHKEKKDIPLDKTLPSIDGYDRIALGFPVWFGGVPRIIQVFAQQYDWTRKRVGIFMTSGWGGIGNIREEITPMLKGAQIRNIKEFSANASEMDIRGWIRRI